MNGYIVCDLNRGYLQLIGPFAYPKWVMEKPNATSLTWVQAHAYAQAYGGEVFAA